MNYSSVIEFGALADGVSKDTSAIQSAIEQVAKTGGGTVFFPAGCYLCGTIYLDNNVHLELAPGAVLRGSPDREDYNADDFSHQNCAEPSENASGAHLIVAISPSTSLSSYFFRC